MTAEHQPDAESRRMVDMMVAAGIPQDDIARVLDVDPKTLRKHYRDELDAGGAKARASVSKFLFAAASGDALKHGATYADCTRAAMFWAKTRMGWRETERIEHSGPDGGPMQTEDVSARAILADRIARFSARSGSGDDPGGTD